MIEKQKGVRRLSLITLCPDCQTPLTLLARYGGQKRSDAFNIYSCACGRSRWSNHGAAK